MEKYQPNLDVTLKFLKENPNVKYVLPTSLFGKINHPKYKIFDNHQALFPFVCKNIDVENNNECYFNTETEEEKRLFDIYFMSFKSAVENLKQFTFLIENFSKSAFCCDSCAWKRVKKEFELAFENNENVIFLWENEK